VLTRSGSHTKDPTPGAAVGLVFSREQAAGCCRGAYRGTQRQRFPYRLLALRLCYFPLPISSSNSVARRCPKANRLATESATTN